MFMQLSVMGAVSEVIVLWFSKLAHCKSSDERSVSTLHSTCGMAHVSRKFLRVNFFYRATCVSAVFTVVVSLVCPSVCLSIRLFVTSRYCIETNGRSELVFDTDAFFHCAIRNFGWLEKLMHLTLEHIVPNAGLGENFATANRSCCQQNSSTIELVDDTIRQSTISCGGLLQGPCCASLHKWGLAQSPSCDCGQWQTMNHIVDTCPLTTFEDGLNLLHEAQSYGWNLQRLQHSRNNN